MWYQLDRVLVASRFGITYQATDTNLGQGVVVREFFRQGLAKHTADGELKPNDSDHSDDIAWGLERFLREVRMIAKFKHPNLAGVQTAFEPNATGYFVMEHIAGTSLQEILRANGRIAERDLKHLFAQLLEAVQRIHEAKFLHLGIKSENIVMRDPLTPVLVGFGAARYGFAHRLGVLRETVAPGYAAIEQYAK